MNGTAIEDMSQKTIVVIGGTTGLGLSACQALVDRGARVVALGLDSEAARQAQLQLGTRGLVLDGDASQPGTAPSVILAAVDHFGSLDGLYHVAGGSGRRWGDGPLHDIPDEGWQRTLELNLNSIFYSNRAAVRRFLEQGTGGTILNVGSVLGWSPSAPYFASHAYAACKAAVVGFTKSCAAYYADQGIRFNVLAPGLVDTPMAQRATADGKIQKFIRTKQPLDGGRIGKPSDLDAAVVYFMSDASRFTTGQILAVDGGWCVSEGQLPIES
jgi:NAD(P)-dependent dehydrogenase (short-subunit alcohol dehydrogenase family)